MCIYCKKEIKNEDKKFILGIEKPYMNLKLHRDCYLKIRDNLVEFLEKNLEDYLNNSIF